MGMIWESRRRIREGKDWGCLGRGAWWGMSSGRSNGSGDGVGKTIMSF
jgi:hypothetical protein